MIAPIVRHGLRFRLPTHVSTWRRAFAAQGVQGSKLPDEEPLSQADVNRLAEEARQSQKAWDMLVPERNMTWKHPAVPFMFLLIGFLQYQIAQKHKEGEASEEELREQRLKRREQRETETPSDT
eukprot:GEMP01100239.1.p1 GENE.GEMP01100239.1~~GEMP01100239.1.p1  ORF type:complete len:124 (+),score=24.37 GEMP01100239.1:142-513(+)